jgi:branched-chain amino acid transport system substrate-binding protein
MAQQGPVEPNGDEASIGVSRRSLLGGAGVLGLGLGISPLLAACSVKDKKKTGATGSSGAGNTKTIKIGYVTPQTGPLAAFGEADTFVIEALKPLLQ